MRDADSVKKVWRRLGSARGTAYLEFAVLVPFFMFEVVAKPSANDSPSGIAA